VSALTTHVLDTSLGRPAAGVGVTLERREAGVFTHGRASCTKALAMETVVASSPSSTSPSHPLLDSHASRSPPAGASPGPRVGSGTLATSWISRKPLGGLCSRLAVARSTAAHSA
jgi:hypothetical protein